MSSSATFVAAVQALSGPPGDAQRQADSWLSEFKYSADAWSTILHLLQQQVSHDVLFHVANIALSKVKNEWKKLSLDDQRQVTKVVRSATFQCPHLRARTAQFFKSQVEVVLLNTPVSIPHPLPYPGGCAVVIESMLARMGAYLNLSWTACAWQRPPWPACREHRRRAACYRDVAKWSNKVLIAAAHLSCCVPPPWRRRPPARDVTPVQVGHTPQSH